MTIWSGWSVATRGLLHGQAGLIALPDLVALRFLFAGVAVLPWAASRPPRLARLGPLRAVAAAAMGGFTFSLCNTGGLLFAPAAHGALTPTLGAVFTGGLAAWFLGERLSGPRLAGLGLILAGALLLVGGTMAADVPAAIFIGHALFAAAALQWSVHLVLVRQAALAPRDALVLTSLGSALIYLPGWLLWRGPDALLAVPWRTLLVQGALHGWLSQVLSVVLYIFGVTRLGASRAAACGALLPPLVALGGALFLGEVPGPAELPGLLAVTAGVWLAAARPR